MSCVCTCYCPSAFDMDIAIQIIDTAILTFYHFFSPAGNLKSHLHHWLLPAGQGSPLSCPTAACAVCLRCLFCPTAACVACPVPQLSACAVCLSCPTAVCLCCLSCPTPACAVAMLDQPFSIPMPALPCTQPRVSSCVTWVNTAGNFRQHGLQGSPLHWLTSSKTFSA